MTLQPRDIDEKSKLAVAPTPFGRLTTTAHSEASWVDAGSEDVKGIGIARAKLKVAKAFVRSRSPPRTYSKMAASSLEDPPRLPVAGPTDGEEVEVVKAKFTEVSTRSTIRSYSRMTASSLEGPEDSLGSPVSDVADVEQVKVTKKRLKIRNPFFKDLFETVGAKHVLFQFAVQHIMEGAMFTLTYSAVPYILAEYHIPGPTMGVLSATVDNLWCLKLPFGILSDGFPVCGYNKLFYMASTIFIGMLSMAMIGFIRDLGLALSFLMILAVQMMMTVCDLLSQARCNEKCKDVPAVTPRLLSFMNVGMLVWSVPGSICLGTTIDKAGPRAPYIIAFVLGIFVSIVVLCGTMEETRKTPDQCAEDRRRVTSSRSIIILGFAMMLAIAGMCGFAGVSNLWVSCCGQLFVASVVMMLVVKLTCPIIGKICLFFFLQSALNPSIGGAAFYFFTDGPEQYPDGPNFGAEFYISVVGSVSCVANICGVLLFDRYAPTMSYRKFLLFANLAPPVLSVLDIILFSRLNRRWGVPDRLFLLGSAAMEKVFILWGTMPGYLIVSQMTPPNMTAILNALVACSYYVGLTASASVGAMLLQVLGVTPDGSTNEGAKFDHLWIAALVVSVASALPILFVHFLVPEGGPQEDGRIDRLREDEVFVGG